MKHNSIFKTVLLLSGVVLLCLLATKCTKEGLNAGKLDRSFAGPADSSVFSPFYDVTTIKDSDVARAQINDKITVKGVQSTIKEYCGIATCHGGPINPKLGTYAEIRSHVNPGNPDASEIWQRLTTNDLNKAMPPVNATHEMSLTDKTIIYNWIKNGAKEFPDLIDFRPAAIKTITSGCTSGNCHNLATSTGSWARAGLLTLAPGSPSPDTSLYTLVRSNGPQYFCRLTNTTLLSKVWERQPDSTGYKDSVIYFYSDTVAYARFRPYKTFSTPVVVSSVRGPLSSYQDILFDIMYPKGRRSNGSVQYTNGSGKKYYVAGNLLNGSNTIISRIDSTILPANLYTGVYATSNSGDMAYSDGGLTTSDIALIKAWYFADPNIPDLWKYGNNNVGIFKYKGSGTVIIKH